MNRGARTVGKKRGKDLPGHCGGEPLLLFSRVVCDIARTVPGVLGERMLGGGDKGASGALVRADSIEALESAVGTGYPRSHPEYADRFAVHVCKMVDGVKILPGPDD